MTSSSASRHVATRCAVAVVLLWTSGLPAAPEKRNPIVVVKAVVKIGGRMKEIDGKTYHLVGCRLDRKELLGVGGMIDVAVVVNGETADRMVRTPTPAERLPGKRSFDDSVVWLRLPEEGQLEYLCGLIHIPPGDARHDPKVLKDLLIRYGYGPFTIDIARIPEADPKTMEELSKVLDRLVPPETKPGTTTPDTKH